MSGERGWNYINRFNPIKFKLKKNLIQMLLSNAGEILFLSFLTIYPFCTFIIIRGVARANRSIRIISARGQGTAQGPQWVQGKALVGGPGGKAPGSSWILPDLHTSEPVCVSVFCSAYSSLSVFYGQVVCAGDGYRKHVLRI